MSFLSRLFSLQAPSGDEETGRLIEEVKALRARSLFFSDRGDNDLAASVMEEAGELADVTVGMVVGEPVYHLITKLLAEEAFAFVPPKYAPSPNSSLSTAAALRAKLREAKRMLEEEERYVTKWASIIGSTLGGMYREFPPQAFVDPDPEGNFEEYSALAPSAPLYTFVPDIPGMIQKIVGTFFGFDVPVDGLFAALREQLEVRLSIASGIHPDERHTSKKQVIFPSDKKGASDAELLDLYLLGTPFHDLLTRLIPLPIPEAVRFEHTHIIAGTGHGKTQALQYLIAADLERAIKEKRSVVVMDGQGDLLQTLLHSDYFRSEKLRNALVYIDPTDIELPVGLNLFDLGFDDLSLVSPLERETIQNGTIELYEYFFGGLLGAELTQRQGLVFRYLATLMMRIPNANIHTLRELMEDGERFRPYMTQLEGSARAFFETRFFDRTFGETKKQILNRLWGVLASSSLDRMMSAKRSSFDLYKALQAGSIVFINTAKDFLGHEGSIIFSRMFVALLGQALMRRAAVQTHERTPTYIYIDEAEDVVDLTLTRLLAQVRKYKGAITFAHQNLDQFEPAIRAGVMANTSVKLAGGVSAKDANALAGDFRCDPAYLLSQKKKARETHFACYVRNVTERAVTLSIPLGFLEATPRLGALAYQELIEVSRQRYGVPQAGRTGAVVTAPKTEHGSVVSPSFLSTKLPLGPLEVDNPTISDPSIVITRLPPKTAPLPVRDLGHGGVKHKALEHLVKSLGEERGFRVVLEAPVHDGAGRVDAVLVRQETSIAFEISVTTTRDHELGNIEKCLALPYAHVVMLTSHVRRRVSLERYISPLLEDADKKRVSFLLPEEVAAFLDGYTSNSPTPERTVKGYTVRSRVREADPLEALARRKAVAKVVARSVSATVA